MISFEDYRDYVSVHGGGVRATRVSFALLTLTPTQLRDIKHWKEERNRVEALRAREREARELRRAREREARELRQVYGQDMVNLKINQFTSFLNVLKPDELRELRTALTGNVSQNVTARVAIRDIVNAVNKMTGKK